MTHPVISFAFALGAAAHPRSLVWRAWTKDDEVHLATTTATDTIELTAYPTGRWRITLGGVISRWHRPKEFRPGWTRGPDIVLPGCSATSEGPADRLTTSTPTTWLPPPALGQVARIQLWFAGVGAAERGWRSGLSRATHPIAVLSLRRAGTLHLIREDEAAESEDVSRPETAERDVVVAADATGRPSFWETLA